MIISEKGKFLILKRAVKLPFLMFDYILNYSATWHISRADMFDWVTA